MAEYYLTNRIGEPEIFNESVRVGFGRGLKVSAEEDLRVVALSADLAESTQVDLFKEAFPERFVEVGVAEQNLVTVASGMASVGKIPFVASYASFSPGRNWEQIRTTICINDQPVKIIGSHAGLSVGPDGATHQMLEDIALMRSLPNMIVIAPGDSVEAEKATIAIAKNSKPSYLRLARDSTPVFTTPLTPFEIGVAYVLREGYDVSIFGTGTMTYRCLLVADRLAREGVSVEVVHVPTIKPLDEDAIIGSLRRTGRGITIEDAQIAGGLGGAIAEILAEKMPTPLRRLGVDDSFGESGVADELLVKWGLDIDGVVRATREFTQTTPQYHR